MPPRRSSLTVCYCLLLSVTSRRTFFATSPLKPTTPAKHGAASGLSISTGSDDDGFDLKRVMRRLLGTRNGLFDKQVWDTYRCMRPTQERPLFDKQVWNTTAA